jgi:hypothetical protein
MVRSENLYYELLQEYAKLEKKEQGLYFRYIRPVIQGRQGGYTGFDDREQRLEKEDWDNWTQNFSHPAFEDRGTKDPIFESNQTVS